MKKGLMIALFGLATAVTVFAFSSKSKNQAAEQAKKECGQPSNKGSQEKSDCCDYQPHCCTKNN